LLWRRRRQSDAAGFQHQRFQAGITASLRRDHFPFGFTGFLRSRTATTVVLVDPTTRTVTLPSDVSRLRSHGRIAGTPTLNDSAALTRNT
jgi:hypothetical protein